MGNGYILTELAIFEVTIVLCFTQYGCLSVVCLLYDQLRRMCFGDCIRYKSFLNLIVRELQYRFNLIELHQAL